MEILLKQLLFIVTLVDCSRILVINPTQSYSHQIVIRPIVKELSKRGHDVVFVTTNPMKNENLTNLKEIDLGLSKAFVDLLDSARPTLFSLVPQLIELLVNLSDTQLSHPEMKALIRNESEYFDLVMIEYLSPTMFAFKERFNCPFIGFMSLNTQNCDHTNVGDFDNPAMYPDSYVSDVVFMLHREYILYPRANKIIKSHFGGNYPDIGEIAADVDMLFSTTTVVLSVVRPVTPATIMIGGGIHIEEPKKLPKIIKTFLDKSKRGTVYISFGSNVASSKLSPQVINMFLKTFSELPYDFLWKFEDENVPTKSDNVMIMNWIPQQDVFRHKNIKLFITQAGLQSSEEALLNHIPMLTIPFFGDQQYNSLQIVTKGIGLVVEDLNTLTCDKFKEMITELIQNSTYSENVKKLEEIVKDEPMKPIEKAIWWTEYVLRHKGAKHLKGPIVPFYQRYLFDVFVFIGLLLLLFGFCLLKCLKLAFNLFRTKNQHATKFKLN